MSSKNTRLKQALILCGGYGTRLGKITKNIPKPLLILRKRKNIIDYIIFNLSRFGLKNIILLCHFQHLKFFKKYHNKKIDGLNIKCIYEKKLLGSAGAIYNIKEKLDDKFLVCNGDSFFDFNILDLNLALKKNKLGIVPLAKIKTEKFRYSYIKLEKNLITDFNHESINKFSLINSGTYILKKKIFKYFKKKENSLESGLFKSLIKRKKLQGKVYKKKFNVFIDIGVKKDLFRSSSFFKKVIYKKAIFLDRDGVINIDKGYTHKIKGFKWRKNIKKLIKFLNDNNYYVFIVTNQSGVGRGYYQENSVKILHKWINNELYKVGAHFDDVEYATFFKYSKIKKYKLNKNLRKPNIGMFKKLKNKWNINLKKSLVVGDKLTDIEFANNADLNSVLINSKDDIFKKIKKLI